MVMSPDRQPIQASIVASNDFPRLRGYPLSLLLTSMTMKFLGYSQYLMLIVISSSIPYSQIVDVSTSCNTVIVGLIKDCKFRSNIISFVITLIVDPKSMRLLGIGFFLIFILTTRIPGYRYLGLIALPDIRSMRWTITLMV